MRVKMPSWLNSHLLSNKFEWSNWSIKVPKNIRVDKSSQLIFVRANGIKMFFVLS